MRISANAADGAHWHHLAISNDPVDEERDDKETEERDAQDFPVQMVQETYSRQANPAHWTLVWKEGTSKWSIPRQQCDLGWTQLQDSLDAVDVFQDRIIGERGAQRPVAHRNGEMEFTERFTERITEPRDQSVD